MQEWASDFYPMVFFSESDSMWGTHLAATFLIFKRSVRLECADPWLIPSSWAISVHVYLLSSFNSFATFSTFSPSVADTGLPYRCFLLTSLLPLLNSRTHLLLVLYASTDVGTISSRAFRISGAPFPRLDSILIANHRSMFALQNQFWFCILSREKLSPFS